MLLLWICQEAINMYSIDTTSYDKAKKYPVDHGYAIRPSAPTSIVVHSTNNSKPNTSFSSEADFLYNSPDVSADFLVGKDGRIVQFLDSGKYQAWHAGQSLSAFVNAKSIGIELHKSTPDPFYPDAQLAALEWLLHYLIATYAINYTMVETHGQIALPGPYQRKTDPDDWAHADFITWRNTHFMSDPLRARTITGLSNKQIYCSIGAFDFYNARGGFKYCGYPLKDMFHTNLGDVLVCERVVIKESTQYGLEQALLSEALREGWLV
jgi:hypothetical protein